MLWTQYLGLAFAVLGIVMAVFPGWFGPLTGSTELAADLFAVIERRIRGGMLLGVGLAFVVRTELRPWSDAIATGVLYFMLGALLARVLGLAVDGSQGRQWMLVAVEAGFMALAAAWLWRSGSGG